MEKKVIIIAWIIFGGIVGWLASAIMRSSHGVLEDVILGIIGAFIGGILMNYLAQSGVTGFNVYSFIISVIGAVVIIALGRWLHRPA